MLTVVYAAHYAKPAIEIALRSAGWMMMNIVFPGHINPKEFGPGRQLTSADGGISSVYAQEISDRAHGMNVVSNKLVES